MLSTTSEYALRALAFLAAQPPGTAVVGRDLAKAAEVPANYLSKILLELRNAELVDTTRGLAGGYRLRKSAHDIFLIDVVELFDGVSRTKPACFLRHEKPCSSSSPCNAHRLWADVQARYLGFLVSTSLASLSPAGDPISTGISRQQEAPSFGGSR
ncbi:MAG: RrF2 family transcriptional regulator [Acidobacteriota bacterium]